MLFKIVFFSHKLNIILFHVLFQTLLLQNVTRADRIMYVVRTSAGITRAKTAPSYRCCDHGDISFLLYFWKRCLVRNITNIFKKKAFDNVYLWGIALGRLHMSPVTGLARLPGRLFVVCSYGKFQPGRRMKFKKDKQNGGT